MPSESEECNAIQFKCLPWQASPRRGDEHAPAESKASSRFSGVYSLMGGQDFAPHTSAKWIRGSTSSTTCEHNSGQCRGATR